MPFVVTNVVKRENGNYLYTLKGLLFRVEADALHDDLVQHDRNEVLSRVYREVAQLSRSASVKSGVRMLPLFARLRTRLGRILHIDSSSEFLDMCLRHYREAGIMAAGRVVKESEQPNIVRGLLERLQPDILVLTGHDGLKKDAPAKSLESYTNSRFYIQSVKEARQYQASKDKLCIFAGACQSYFEAIMAEGANFASSPGRILIHALDPGIVSEKIANTDTRVTVTPGEIAKLTVSGAKGIGGIDTKGHKIKV